MARNHFFSSNDDMNDNQRVSVNEKNSREF